MEEEEEEVFLSFLSLSCGEKEWITWFLEGGEGQS